MKNNVSDIIARIIARIIYAIIIGVFAFLTFSVFMKNLGHENYFQKAFVWSVAWCVGTFVGSTILEEIKTLNKKVYVAILVICVMFIIISFVENVLLNIPMCSKPYGPVYITLVFVWGMMLMII